MKKHILIITCLLLMQLVIAQSPGGVSGASQWYNNTGASTTQWTDSSGNNNNVPVSTAPSFTNSINFNTVSTFNGSSYYRRTSAGTNLPTATSGSTYFYVAKTNSSATNEREVLGARGYYYNDGFNSGQYNNTNLYAGSYYGGYSQDANITNTWSLGNSKLVRAGYSNGTNNNRYISQNGSAETVSGTSSSISFASNNFSIGATYNGDRQWIGDIAEIIVYPSKLVQSNYDKVESYLAIKYGITKAGNYIASDGATTYWNATTNSGYTNNIAGIGRDDASALNQKQSQSQNGGNQVIFGLGSVAATNAANANTFTADKQFLLWGDNGLGGYTTFTTGGVTYNNRLSRVWKTQNSNSLNQNGQLLIPVYSAGNASSSAVALLYNPSDATFAAGNTLINHSGTTTINGLNYYVFNLTDTQVNVANFYFTLALYVAAPGGVLTGLMNWFKADADVYSNAGTTLATNGSSVQQWNDQSGNGYHLNSVTATAPVYYNTTVAQNINFNPTLKFNENGGIKNLTTMFSNTSAYTFGGVVIDETTHNNSYKVIFTVGNFNTFGFFKLYGSPWGTNGWGLHTNGADSYFVNGASGTNKIGANGFSASGGSNGSWNGTGYNANVGVQPQVFLIKDANSTGTTQTRIIDGYSVTTTGINTGLRSEWFKQLNIGVYNTNNNPINGRIPEFFSYSSDLSATDAQKVNSYLAIKYGTTLGQGGVNIVNNNGNNYNYLNSDGNIVWNASTNSAYKYHIAGIGRDDASALNQKQSQSQNGGNQVIFGLGSVAATNAANANTFTADKQFLLWGDNGASGPVAFSDTADATIFSRLARTWFVDNSNNYAQDTQLLIPVALTTGGTSPKLVMNTSSTFASGTNTYISLSATTTINSVSYYVVNFTAAQVATDFYFSVVTNQKAPGGVISAVWYKTNDNTVFSNAGTTLATNNQTVQQWNDSNGTGANIANATAAQRPLYSNSTSLQNFHPTVTFNGTYQFLSYTPTAGQEVIDRSRGSFYVVGYNNSTVSPGGLVGFDASMDYPGLYSNYSTNRLLFFPFDYTTYGTNTIIRFKPFIAGSGWQNNSGTNGTSNSVRMRLDGFEDVWVNGINNVNTSNSLRELRIGCDTDFNYTNGKLNEVIVFPNKLTADEMTRVDSYLAIKFGLTLNQQQSRNYTNSANNIIWDATANAQYNKNITGIGRDDFSTLHQLQSKSTNGSDNILMSITANASDTHALQTSFASFDNDKQFLIFGDNQLSGFTAFTNPSYPDLSHRLKRVWKAQTSNYNLTGNDNVVFNIPDAMLASYRNSGKGLYVIMSTTADFSSNNYFIPITTTTYTVGGQVYTSVSYNVNSAAFSGFTSNGSFYFTLAGAPIGPGGVLANYWMRSDKGITTSGSNVNKWVDQAYGKDATQVGTNTNLPAYVNVTNATQAANFNFNPYVEFTANTQALGNLNTQLFSDDVSAVNSFMVTKDIDYSGRFFGVDYDLIATAQGGYIFDWHMFQNATFAGRGATWNSGLAIAITYSPALSTTLSNISHYSLTSSTFQHRLNGSVIGNNVTGLSTYFGKGGYVYGNNILALGGDDSGVTAQIAEHLILEGALTALQRRQVESYLAINMVPLFQI